MAKTPQVGEQARDFELEATEGPFRLSEHRGERVVLLFHPGEHTMGSNRRITGGDNG
jgi:peroxiredoxin Q/BCP